MIKQVLLDTNFILTCLKQKIDFFEYLELEGYAILIPDKVISELEKLKKNYALKLLEKEEVKFKKIYLQGKNVDNSIINFARKNPEIVIGTLDREMRKKIRNPKMSVRNKKKLEIL
jgi:rRNA-processing protein FCF1